MYSDKYLLIIDCVNPGIERHNFTFKFPELRHHLAWTSDSIQITSIDMITCLSIVKYFNTIRFSIIEI